MTIDEAISHALEVAEKNECKMTSDDGCTDVSMKQCAAEHRQLAEWLRELKKFREVYGVCPSYEMCIPECKEGYNAQIAEYKRLLKMAVEDFAVYGALKDLSAEQRVQNPDWRRFNRVFDILDRQWRYADEAEKLIESRKLHFIGGENMREYEIMISGTIVVEAENEADAIDEALTNGCDEYYAEVIDSWEIDDEEEDDET